MKIDRLNLCEGELRGGEEDGQKERGGDTLGVR